MASIQCGCRQRDWDNTTPSPRTPHLRGARATDTPISSFCTQIESGPGYVMPDDVLTQNEIDSLLAQAMGIAEAPGELPERFRSVQPYDFRQPSKLSKEQRRTLQLIFVSFARTVASNLSATLRSQVHLALVSIRQAVFEEYARGLASSTLLNLATA